MNLRKFLAIFLSLTLCLTFAPAVAAAEVANLEGMTTFTVDRDTVTVSEGSSSNYEVVVYTDQDDDTTYTPVTTVNGEGDTVYSLPDGIADGVTAELQIGLKKKGGSYVFQGSGTGSIVVKKEATAPTTVYLNGLSLTSRFTAPLSVKKDSATTCTIYAVEGTVNTLADNIYNDADTYTGNLAGEKAVVKLKDGSDVTICGGGALNIIGNAKNGIKSTGKLTVSGEVELNITALDNGISSEQSLSIDGGTLVIKAKGGDGIKACSDTEEIGSITITEGSFVIDAYGDGIQAMKTLEISGGKFAITTYGGYTAAYDKDDESYPSAKGLKASGSYTPDGSTEEVDAEDCVLTITGGLFSLNTADDAIHADGDVTITGGVFTIYTGDDGVHADDTLILGVSGGADSDVNLAVNASYEGLEGADVILYSGSYDVTASDDGINAAGGSSDSGTDNGSQDHFGPGGNQPGGNQPGGNQPGGSTASGNYSLSVLGGNVLVNAEGDGLDSNGTLTLSGGTVVVWGQKSGGDNAPLDSDGAMTINGATVFAAGSSSMAELPSSGTFITTKSSSSGAPGGNFSSNFSASAGQTITVKNASGNILYTIQAVKAVNFALYASPDLTSSSGTFTVSGSAGTVAKTTCSHSMTTLGSTATCGEAGGMMSICTLCGEVDTAAAAATGEHAYVFTSATDETDTYTCLICGDKKAVATDDEHTWDKGVVTAEATCTENGVITYTCTDCGETKNETIPATGHSFSEETGACTVCNASGYTVTFAAGEHAVVTVYKTQDTTAAADSGSTYYARSSSTGLIDISGDGQINFIVAVENGYTISGVSVAPADNYKNLKVISEDQTGGIYRITKITGNLTVTVSVTSATCAHIWNEGIVTAEATCTEDGEITYICTLCSETRSEAIPALGHSWDEGVTQSASTCGEADVTLYTCTRCGQTQLVAGSIAGHTPVTDPGIPATCTEDGLTEGSHCQVCGAVLTPQQILPATGHSYVLSAQTEATCTEDGQAQYTCTLCTHSYQEILPATGHSYIISAQTEATCTEAGEVQYTCSLCGHSYQEILPATDCPSAHLTDVEQGWYHDAVDYMVAGGYMNGISSAQFGIGGTLTRAMLVTILYRLSGSPAVTGDNPFTDVPEGTWYTTAIIWAYENDVVKGVGGGKFAPENPITREQIATILYRYAQAEPEENDALSSYPDKDQVGGYAVEAMGWAVSNKLINGGVSPTGTLVLDPTNTAKREQCAVILHRYLTVYGA